MMWLVSFQTTVRVVGPCAAAYVKQKTQSSKGFNIISSQNSELLTSWMMAFQRLWKTTSAKWQPTGGDFLGGVSQVCAYPHFYPLFIHTPHVCPGRRERKRKERVKSFDTVPNRRIRVLSKTQKTRFTERSEIIFWSCALFCRLEN